MSHSSVISDTIAAYRESLEREASARRMHDLLIEEMSLKVTLESATRFVSELRKLSRIVVSSQSAIDSSGEHSLSVALRGKFDMLTDAYEKRERARRIERAAIALYSGTATGADELLMAPFIPDPSMLSMNESISILAYMAAISSKHVENCRARVVSILSALNVDASTLEDVFLVEEARALRKLLSKFLSYEVMLKPTLGMLTAEIVDTPYVKFMVVVGEDEKRYLVRYDWYIYNHASNDGSYYIFYPGESGCRCEVSDNCVNVSIREESPLVFRQSQTMPLSENPVWSFVVQNFAL